MLTHFKRRSLLKGRDVSSPVVQDLIVKSGFIDYSQTNNCHIFLKSL